MAKDDFQARIDGLNELIQKMIKRGSLIPSEIRATMRRVGLIVERRMKKILSGRSHVLYPGNSNPHPGVLTGNLRASVSSDYTQTGYTSITGPSAYYAAYLDQGTERMQAYPFVEPTFSAVRQDIIHEFETLIKKVTR